jgi:Ca-activated chloride channel family protein
MFHRLRSPRFTGLCLRWPEGSTSLWQSALPRSVFDGDTISVFAQFEAPVKGQVTLRGTGPDGSELTLGTVSVEGCTENFEVVSRLVASERAKVLENAQELALAYQLLTDHTHVLMVHIRSLEDKAVDMPELHKVQQMVPAGWGGVGRIAVCDDAGAYRFGSTLDLPMFSRRSVLPDEHSRKDDRGGGLDDTEPRDDSDERFPGLTPLGVQRLLIAMPSDRWPQSYDELNEMGLGDWLVAWLELAIDVQNSGKWSESLIVRVFLAVVANREFSDSGEKPNCAGGWLSRWRPSTEKSPKHGVETLDPELERRVQQALTGMTATRWPARACAMDV